MSEIPYLPLYVNDFEGDTAHLTLEEDGAYNRLIRLCWRTSGCSIPNDPAWIMKRLRINKKQYDAVIKPLIVEFFIVKKGRVFQKRLKEEFLKINKTISERKKAGKKGGTAKALKDKDKTPSKAKDLPVAKQEQNSSIYNHTYTYTYNYNNNNITPSLESGNDPDSLGKYQQQICDVAFLKKLKEGDHQKIDEWLMDDLSVEKDILPTISEVYRTQSARDNTPGSLAYYDTAVRNAKTKRLANGPFIPIVNGKDKSLADWCELIKFDMETETFISDFYRDHRKRNFPHGNPPTMPGCSAPVALQLAVLRCWGENIPEWLQDAAKRLEE